MKKIFIIAGLIIIIIIGFILYNQFGYLKIIVRFDDLEPIEKQMKVYYKGFRIGKTVKIYPDKDYQNTYLKVKIKPRNINLPSNITAKLKRTPTGEYLNILYPASPSLKRISNNMTIQGLPSKDIKNILNESIAEDDIDTIINEATSLMDTATNTVQSLGQVFNRVSRILDNIDGDIKKTTLNLAKISSNIENISNNIDNSIGREQAVNSFKNIEQTTENINNFTKNLNEISEIIEDETMPIVNSVLCETNSTMENAEEITSGIKSTLKKRMGLMRLMFGKPVNNGCP